MDKFVLLLFDDNFGVVNCFVGKRASVVIRAAVDDVNLLHQSVTYFTNIPEEAMQEYVRLGRVRRRHKPLQVLRRL